MNNKDKNSRKKDHLNEEIENFNSLKKQAEDLLCIQRDLSIAINYAEDLNKVIDIVLNSLIKSKVIDSGGFYLFDDSDNSLRLFSHKGLPEGIINEISVFNTDSPQFRIIMIGEPIYTHYSKLKLQLNGANINEDLKAVVIIPIKFENKIIAALNLASHEYDEIPQVVKNTIESISFMIGGAIAKAKAEADHNECRENFRSIFENAPIGIMEENLSGLKKYIDSLNLDDNIDFREYFEENNDKIMENFSSSKIDNMNKAAFELFEVNNLDDFNNNIRVFLNKDLINAHKEAFISIMNGNFTYECECRINTLNGKRKVALLKFVLLQGFKDSWEKAVITLMDITDKKEIEKERVRNIRTLSRKQEEIERFAYTISHDLRTPLLTIKGFISCLKEDLNKNDSDATAKDISYIELASEKINLLLNDLIEVIKIDKFKEITEKINLNDLISDILIMFGKILNDNKINIDISPSLPEIKGNKRALSEIYQNLIENSIKYMGNNKKAEIEIGMLNKKGQQIFYVKDNGIGIDKKNSEKIFDLFEQIGKNSEGTGIGLTIVKRAIENHGGKIWVGSDGEGRGSTFYFTLK